MAMSTRLGPQAATTSEMGLWRRFARFVFVKHYGLTDAQRDEIGDWPDEEVDRAVCDHYGRWEIFFDLEIDGYTDWLEKRVIALEAVSRG